MFHHLARLSHYCLVVLILFLCSSSSWQVHATIPNDDIPPDPRHVFKWPELASDLKLIVLKYLIGAKCEGEIRGFTSLMMAVKSNKKVYDLAIESSSLSQVGWVDGPTSKTVDNYVWNRLIEERYRSLLRLNQARIEQPEMTEQEIQKHLSLDQKYARSFVALCTRLKLTHANLTELPSRFLSSLELFALGKSQKEIIDSCNLYANDLIAKSRDLTHMPEGQLRCFTLLFFETARSKSDRLASIFTKVNKKYPTATSWTLNRIIASELWHLKPLYCFPEGCPDDKEKVSNLNLAGMVQYLKKLSLTPEESAIYHNEYLALATDATEQDLRYALQPNIYIGNYVQAKHIADRLAKSSSPKDNDLLWKLADAYASVQSYPQVLEILDQLKKENFIENEPLHYEAIYATTKLALGDPTYINTIVHTKVISTQERLFLQQVVDLIQNKDFKGGAEKLNSDNTLQSDDEPYIITRRQLAYIIYRQLNDTEMIKKLDKS